MTTPQPGSTAAPFDHLQTSVNSTQVSPTPNDPEFGKQTPDSDYVEIDFWGASEEKVFELPGQEKIPAHLRQTITYKTMDEGMRTRFQKKTNKPVKLDQDDNSATLSVDTAGDRLALLEISITNWTLRRAGQPVEYRPYVLKEWLKVANPLHVDKLERAIREDNPWMINEMSSDAIQKEIDRLEVRKAEAVAREESEERF